MNEIRGSEYLDFLKNPQDWEETEVQIRLREHADYLRLHGYCEADISALAQIKAELYMDKYEGWSNAPRRKKRAESTALSLPKLA